MVCNLVKLCDAGKLQSLGGFGTSIIVQVLVVKSVTYKAFSKRRCASVTVFFENKNQAARIFIGSSLRCFNILSYVQVEFHGQSIKVLFKAVPSLGDSHTLLNTNIIFI